MREPTERPKQALSGETLAVPSDRIEPAKQRRDQWGLQFRGQDAICVRTPSGKRLFWVSKEDLVRMSNRAWKPIMWGDKSWEFALETGPLGTPVCDRSLYAYEMAEEDFVDLHATDPARQAHAERIRVCAAEAEKSTTSDGPGGYMKMNQVNL